MRLFRRAPASSAFAASSLLASRPAIATFAPSSHERPRDGEADAAAAARDDGDVAVEESGPEDAGHGVTLAHALPGLRSPMASANASTMPHDAAVYGARTPMLP